MPPIVQRSFASGVDRSRARDRGGTPAWPVLWSFILALTLAFGFLGSRPLWEPDEGRYTNVALVMLEGGNWIEPKRNADVGHWTKPPLTYWALAASMDALGATTWAARVPSALAYLSCALFVWLAARRLASGAENLAALVYLTMLLPSVAGQLVTTDGILAACEAFAVWGFVQSRFGAPAWSGWGMLLMWIGFGAGFLAKGPPALVPLLPIAALHFLAPRSVPLRWPWHLAGVAAFLVLAIPWYAAVVLRHQGLLAHLLGAEVVDRVASDRFGRNGEWYGWLKVFAPTIVVGAIPWLPSLFRWFATQVREAGRWRNAQAREAAAGELFVCLWVLVPLAVFCMARSRLPLYVLPVFAPLAIAIARTRTARGLAIPAWPRLAIWAAVLLGFRFAASIYPADADTSHWALALRERAQRPIRNVVFVEDDPRYGLHLYLGVEVRRVSRMDVGSEAFNPRYDGSLWRDLQKEEAAAGRIYVARAAIWDDIGREMHLRGYRARALGQPHEGRVVFDVEKQDEGDPR